MNGLYQGYEEQGLPLIKHRQLENKKYGIKICNPKHGKDIRKLRICW